MTRVLCVFLGVVSLLTVPVGVAVMRDPPHVFYARIHDGPHWEDFDRSFAEAIHVTEDERGFIDGIYFEMPLRELGAANFIGASSARQPELQPSLTSYVSFAPRYNLPVLPEDHGVVDFHFIISPEYIFFRDGNSSLAIPTRYVSAWALREGNLEEIFDHLALHNRYFSGIVAPIFILLFAIFLFSQVVILLAAVWMFGWWQKTSGFLSWRERLAVCVFACVPAALLAFVLGLFFPVVHVFLFQFGMIYFAYKTLKEYFNEGAGYLAREVV